MPDIGFVYLTVSRPLASQWIEVANMGHLTNLILTFSVWCQSNLSKKYDEFSIFCLSSYIVIKLVTRILLVVELFHYATLKITVYTKCLPSYEALAFKAKVRVPIETGAKWTSLTQTTKAKIHKIDIYN